MEELNFHGMKAHDFHVLMQQLLRVALRHVIPKAMQNTVCRLCLIYRRICAKMLEPTNIGNLEDDVVETLCLPEKYFSPSFCDIMIHLTIHLV